MRHFQGFEAARAALSRHNAGVHFETSPDMAERLRKTFGQDLTVSQAVDRVVEDVGRRGDEALYEYTRKFDGTDLAQAEVTQQEITEACKSISEVLLSALRQAAKRVHDFHIERKGKLGVSLDSERLGTSVRPLDRVGVYVPGGRACYPSTVLMTVVPARAAGVREVILCTPPTREGRVPAPTLAACQTAGVDRVFKIGGAQAIAAMAFGTETVPAVDKICGPGNIFVTLAKKKVFGTVAIDGLQGPSELAIVADETANAAFCAADLLAQGEHDPLASAVLITTSAKLADDVMEELRKQAGRLSRGEIVSGSVMENGATAVVDSIDDAVRLVNLYAPEHVSLAIADARKYVGAIQNAGCIFVGGDCPPAFGDYIAGPSHVLPTGGTARFSSPLGVQDFLKTTSVVSFSPGLGRSMASAACVIAQSEGFDAHCRSIELRADDGK